MRYGNESPIGVNRWENGRRGRWGKGRDGTQVFKKTIHTHIFHYIGPKHSDSLSKLLSEYIHPKFIQKTYLKTKGSRAPWICTSCFWQRKAERKKRGRCVKSQEIIKNDKINMINDQKNGKWWKCILFSKARSVAVKHTFFGMGGLLSSLCTQFFVALLRAIRGVPTVCRG